MGTEHRETGRGNRKDQDNVVQLPRDWLGPREELVPLGPRAREAEAAPGAADSTAFAAEDFWGENSESLHTAVRGPSVEPASADVPEPLYAPDGPARLAARARRGFRQGPLARLVVGLAAAAALITVMVLAWPGAGPRSGPQPSLLATADPVVLIGGLAATGGALDAVVRRLVSHQLSVPVRPARRHHARAARHPAVVAVASAPPSLQPAPSVSQGSGASSGSAAASSAAGAVASAPAASTSDSGGSGGPSTSSAAQPAFGANGTLGPGSSPNG